jgi:hypothetical protein
MNEGDLGSVTCPGPGFSGKPWAATTQIALPQGDQRIQLEPRGARRLSAQSLLDVRVSRTIVVRGVGRVEVLVDVLNSRARHVSRLYSVSDCTKYGRRELDLETRRSGGRSARTSWPPTLLFRTAAFG